MEIKGNFIVKKFILKSDVIVGEQSVPLYDLEAFAGIDAAFIDRNLITDELIVSELPKCDGAMHVVGDSMYPMFLPGDLVLYKTVPNRRGGLLFGEIYLLSYEMDGEEHISIKYLEQSETYGFYKLISNNPKYEPYEICIDNVHTMAIVKAAIRRLD